MSAIYQPYSVQGQVVLITGASAGIGEACAERFAEAKCKLILTARRIERLQQLQKRLQDAYDVPIHVMQLDMQDTETIASLPSRLPDEFKEVDILVNNAGLALGVATVYENDMQDIKTMFETNVLGLIALTRALTPGMVQRNRGHVVNMGSVAGSEAYGGGSGYCATKFAVDAFTTATRHDLVGTNIRVTVISPGAVKTEFSNVRFKGDTDKADAVYKGIEPLTAADIADHVLYAVTRPAHVQIADIRVYATYQCSAKGLARVLPH